MKINISYLNVRISIVIFKIIICLFLIHLPAFSQWNFVGLENHIVNSLVIDDQNRLIAGTDKGLYIYHNANWLEISKLLPSQNMIVTGPRRFVAALGGGSNSDGLYSADAKAEAPYYQLSLIGYMDFPQSLGKTENSDVVYVGGPNKMAYSILDTANGEYMDLMPIKIPYFPFGIENPKCAGVHVFSGDNRLYAGGYDMSPDPGPGSLLWEMQDTMTVLAPLNTSSLTEGYTELGGTQLYIGTIDSGIYSHSAASSRPPVKYAETPSDEPVNDMITISSLVMSDILCIAVKSGVYLRAGNSWNEVGDIPEEPNCIVRMLDSSNIVGYVLYAGTKNGVYHYWSATDPINNYQKDKVLNNVLLLQLTQFGTVSISFYLQKEGKVKVDILDLAGRNISTPVNGYYRAGKHVLSVNEKDTNTGNFSNGVYILRLSTGGKQISKRFVLAK